MAVGGISRKVIEKYTVDEIDTRLLDSIIDPIQLEDEKLADIIFNMKPIHKKKHDIIYHQGDPAEMIYVLIEGEVKLTKKATLF